MTAGKCEISRCGLCRFYRHEGRRDGVCNQLNVNVNAQWKACSLAVSPFISASEKPAGITPDMSYLISELAVSERIVSELAVSELSKEAPVLPLLNTSAPATVSVTTTKSLP